MSSMGVGEGEWSDMSRDAHLRMEGEKERIFDSPNEALNPDPAQ